MTINYITPPSAATLKLRLYRDSKLLSTATCFLEAIDNEICLVTALHNFTGRDYFTNKCIDQQRLSTPNRFSITAFFQESDRGFWNLKEIDRPIFNDNGPNFWYDKSHLGGDIAIFPLFSKQNDVNSELITFDYIRKAPWRIECGTDLFALGYPSAIEIKNTPI